MIYFDSGATTLRKPPEVARAVLRAMEQCASPGRGGHEAAMAAAEAVFDAVSARLHSLTRSRSRSFLR